MSVRVDDFEVSVVNGTHKFAGISTSGSIDLKDGHLTFVDDGNPEHLAALAFKAGRTVEAHSRGETVGDVNPNIEVLNEADPLVPKWKRECGGRARFDPEGPTRN
jgi:hypothetical protein